MDIEKLTSFLFRKNKKPHVKESLKEGGGTPNKGKRSPILGVRKLSWRKTKEENDRPTILIDPPIIYTDHNEHLEANISLHTMWT